MNHKTAIITSMNLYEYSQLNNTELGIIVTKEGDPQLYEQINETVKKIIRVSHEYEFEIKKVEKIKTPIGETEKKEINIKGKKESVKPENGFCIRCHSVMNLNPDKPLCSKCYPIWAKFSDPTYPEKYCHVCGKESKQSVEKPVCYTCYKKYYK
jgi:hypothetical protein